MKQLGLIFEAYIYKIVGFLLALVAFEFVLDKGLDAGIPEPVAYIFAFLAFVAVLAFFIEQLRVWIRAIVKFPR